MSKDQLTVVGVDLEGAWNVPLMQNAADISGATLEWIWVEKDCPPDFPAKVDPAGLDVLQKFDHVLGCEPGPRSASIYEVPAPRGTTAILMGNEQTGLPKAVLSRVEKLVSIPMRGKGMSSINVASAAAVVAYVLERDLGRKARSSVSVAGESVDVLIESPDDASELGSLLRSLWAFGWKKVYLDDRRGSWFAKDRPTVLKSRAAARRSKNPLAVLPSHLLDFSKYQSVLACTPRRSGSPLSRLQILRGNVLLVFCGQEAHDTLEEMGAESLYVDTASRTVAPRFRHRGSILFSAISEKLGWRHA